MNKVNRKTKDKTEFSILKKVIEFKRTVKISLEKCNKIFLEDKRAVEELIKDLIKLLNIQNRRRTSKTKRLSELEEIVGILDTIKIYLDELEYNKQIGKRKQETISKQLLSIEYSLLSLISYIQKNKE